MVWGLGFHSKSPLPHPRVVFRNIFMRLRLLYSGGFGYELHSGH